METQDDTMMITSKDHTHIVKGKRTKRIRPQSPIPFAITTANSSSCSSDGGGSGGGSGPTTITLSPASSSTEEEEDMANCLILLAQGQSRGEEKQFSSRRYIAGGGGYYVYECKTCNRSFPSFQALGGHRASHKKPRMAVAMVAEERKQHLQLAFSDEEDVHYKKILNPIPLNFISSNNTKTKIHECSVCGAEFSSGQALGGHMRRHRPPTTTPTATTTTVTTTTAALGLTPIHLGPQKTVFSLDLNLPAAPEDDHQRSPARQSSQPQPPLIFSGSALVDCHY